MQSLSIFILFWFYIMAMMGFIEIFLIPLGINISSFYIAIILSSVGIVLGFLFYAISLLKSSLKATITIGIMGTILLLILITYLLYGLSALVELFIYLLKIGFFLLMCVMPIIGVYSILKKQSNVLKSAGIGILFFFFFVIILSKINPVFSAPFYTENQIALLLLFFLLFICFLEFGASSIYFGSVVKKMIPNEGIDESILLRLNRVINRYFIQISGVLGLCYIISLLLIWYRNNIGFTEFFGLSLNSSEGLFLLIIFVIVGAFIFWYLIPREKTDIS